MTRQGRLVAAVAAAAALAPAQAAAKPVDAGGLVVGKGKVDGARGQVRAYAWTSDIRGPKTVTMPLVATGIADANGRFTLRAPDAQKLAKMGQEKGSVDLVVRAPVNGGWAETVFSTRVARQANGKLAAASASSGVAAVPSIRLQRLPLQTVRSAHHDCKDWGDVGAPKVTREAVWKRATVVGELNNTYPDTQASFTYGTTADSQISVGLQVEGKAFRFNGSTSVANSRGAAIGPQNVRGPYARRIRSNFWYGRWRFGLCPAPGAGSHYWETKATGWSGGSSSRRQAGTLHVCYGGNDYEKNTKFIRDTNKAVVWEDGVSVGGVGLNVRSGFSRYARIEYQFGNAINNHRLCGSGNRDETTAGRIYSGKGKPRT